jgi:hypothetical protein
MLLYLHVFSILEKNDIRRPVELRTFFTPAPSLRDLSRWPRDIADAYRRGYDDALRDTAEGSFTIDGTTRECRRVCCTAG